MGVFFIIFGMITIVFTVLKLPFYWESKKARRLRRVFGDTISTFIYIIIGIVISSLGVLDLMGKISLK